MIKQIIPLNVVRNDPAGKGHYHAPRNGRKHNGIDYTCTPGEVVLTPVGGVVTRLGYAYADDLDWRYVEITRGVDNLRHRFFYVEPSKTMKVGSHVSAGAPIGVAQDIPRKYPDQQMIAHVHHEVKDQSGNYMDPTTA